MCEYLLYKGITAESKLAYRMLIVISPSQWTSHAQFRQKGFPSLVKKVPPSSGVLWWRRRMGKHRD